MDGKFSKTMTLCSQSKNVRFSDSESSQNCLKCIMLDEKDTGENDSCFFGLKNGFLYILPITSLS